MQAAESENTQDNNSQEQEASVPFSVQITALVLWVWEIPFTSLDCMLSQAYSIVWGDFENNAETQLKEELFWTGGAVNHIPTLNRTQEKLDKK